MLINTILKAQLSLFDGAAGAAGTATASGSDTSGAAASPVSDDMGDSNIPWELLKGGKPQELLTEEGTDTGAVSDESADSLPGFKDYKEAKDYIRERFPEESQKDADRSFARRMKNHTKEVQNLNNALGDYKKIAEAIALKYPGVDFNDPAALLAAVQGDDSYLKQRALDTGSTVQQVRADVEREAETRNLRQRVAQMEADNQARATMAELNRQAQELMAEYPDFSLEDAFSREEFVEQLAFTKHAHGVEDVRAAFEYAYRKELQQKAVEQTADSTRTAISQNLRANQYMPSPAGRSTPAKAPSGKGTLKNMTARELAELRYSGVDISQFFDE